MSISAADQLLAGTRTQVGTFEGVPYVQYDGISQGETSTGAFRVPYRITAPAPAPADRTLTQLGFCETQQG
jgi:hypothetical protein